MRHRDSEQPVTGISWAVLMIVLSMLLVSPLQVVMKVSGATTTGATDALVSPEQPIRDDSTGIPVVGFGATDAGTNEILLQVDVGFVNVAGFNQNDLENLNTDQTLSGVALYRDSGNVDDQLDTGDDPVPQANINNINWVAGTTARITLNGGGGNTEPVPDTATGAYEWFIVIRTSATIGDGDRFHVGMGANSITFSDGGGVVSQPASMVMSNDLVADVTTAIDITGASMGGTWVGYRGVQVNYATPLGIHIVDGGPFDTLREVWLRDTRTDFNNGDFGTGGNWFWELTTDSATSGVGIYRNDGTDLARLDASDTPITLSSISWVGGTWVVLQIPQGAEPIPDSDPGTFTYFIVVRTGWGINDGDRFRIRLEANMVGVTGLAGDGVNPEWSWTPEAQYTAPDITVDRRTPWFTSWSWSEGSPYLAVNGGILYFSDLMGSSTVYATLSGTANDAGSGLTGGVARADFSSEPSLASSPPSDTTPAAWWGQYGINASSNDSDTPAMVSIYDRVGNTISWSFWYLEDLLAPSIIPSPGWTYISGQPPFWIDYSLPGGKLWFSDWITGTDDMRIQVNFQDTGAGLQNASGSYEPTLAGGPWYSGCNWNNLGGVASRNNCRADYYFNTASTNGSEPVTIYLTDQVGNTASMDFEYGEDNEVPSVSIVYPGPGEVLTGGVVIAASASDLLTDIDGNTVQVSVNGAGWNDMFWNGTYWIYQLQTAQYSDGNYRLIVRADDMVGNTGAATVDVVFANGAPTVNVLTPANGDIVRGDVNITAMISSGLKVTSVDVRIDSGGWTPMSYDPLSNTYYWVWNTSSLSGLHTISVRGTAGTLIGQTSTLSVTVDNVAPTANAVYPSSGSELSGMHTVQLLASDNVGVGAAYVQIGGGGLIPMSYSSLSGYYEYVWDTSATPDGVYDLGFLVLDLVGNNATTAVTNIQVDNTPPGLLVLTPVPNEVVSGTYAVTVDSSDGTGSGFNVSGGVLFRVDNAQWMAMGGGPPTWTYALDTTNFSDGRHTLLFASVDDAGNSVYEQFDVTIDNSLPGVDILAPASGEFIEGIYDFQVYISDTVSLARLNVTVTDLDSNTTVLVKTITPTGSGTYTISVNTNTWSDGNYSMDVSGSDNAGHTSTDAALFMVDNTFPTLSIVYPRTGSTVEAQVSIKAPASDVFLVAVEYAVDGGAWTDVSQPLDTSQYTDGTHTINVRASDLAGHSTGRSVLLTFDNSLPGVDILAPASGEFIEGIYDFQVHVSDTVSLARLNVTVKNEDSNTTVLKETLYPGSSGTYTISVNTNTWSDGNYSMDVSGSDNAGHTSTDAALFMVDNTFPAISIGSPLTGSVVDGQVTVEVSASDVFMSAVEYAVDGGVWSAVTVPLDTTGYPDGPHTLTVHAVDQTGHTSERSLLLTFDNTAPQAAITTPATGTPVSGLVVVEATAIDSVGISSVRISAGNVSGDMSLDASRGIYRYLLDTRSLSDGKVPLIVSVDDLANHSTSVQVDVTVDNTAPVISLPEVVGDSGAIVIRVQVSDVSGVEQVRINLDGQVQDMVREDASTYRLTFFTSTADNGVHEFEVTATDTLGNTGSMSDQFTVANPTDYWQATLDATPFLIFLLLVIAFILVLLLIRYGRLRAWWTGKPRPGRPLKPEPLLPEEEEEPGGPEPPTRTEGGDAEVEDVGAASSPEAASVATEGRRGPVERSEE